MNLNLHANLWCHHSVYSIISLILSCPKDTRWSFSGERELRLELQFNPVLENMDSTGIDEAVMTKWSFVTWLNVGHINSFIRQNFSTSSVVETLINKTVMAKKPLTNHPVTLSRAASLSLKSPIVLFWQVVLNDPFSQKLSLKFLIFATGNN